MTSKQKIEISMSEARTKLNGILDIASEERTAEQLAEVGSLSESLQSLETDYRAAILAEPKTESVETEVDAEARERREIRSKAKLAGFIGAALEDRRIDGAELEVSQAFGCKAGRVPLEMFEREREEHRVITPSPSTSDQVIARPIVPAIFQRSAAAWLGVDMPSVGAGDAGYITLGTSVTGGPKAKSSAADETAGAFVVTSAQPRRLTGSFRFTAEDAARLSGLEDSLSANLSSVLSDALDNQAVNGSGSGDGTINGLLAILANPSNPATGQETFARYVAAIGSHVDGTFAVDLGGVRVLCRSRIPIGTR